jgi:hypothetical protein
MFAIHAFARKSVKPVLGIVAIISLALAAYAVHNNDATSAFYLAHMRAWELLAGALLALNVFPAVADRRINAVLGWAGLLMIIIPVFLYTDRTPFPGFSAAVPVLGTAFIIYSSMNETSMVGKIMGFIPLVFIGQISYSLYLWHWPLILFAEYYIIRPMTGLELSLLLVVILAISSLSWRFVETPFRSRSFLSTRQVFAFGFVAMTVIIAAAGIVYGFDGFPSREGPTPLVDFIDKETTDHYTKCAGTTDGFEHCLIGDKTQPETFMLWGDSHASSLRRAVERAARKKGFLGLFTYKLACPPLLNVSREFSSLSSSCAEYNEGVLRYLSAHPEISTVILAGRWPFYVEGSDYKPAKLTTLTLADFLGEKVQGAENQQVVEFSLRQTIQALLDMNRKIVIVSPVPEIGYDVPSANFIALRSGRDLNEIIALSTDKYFARNQGTFAILSKVKEEYGIQVVNPWTALCVESRCRVTIDGVPLYKDDDHLSLFGSEVVSIVLEPIFEK